MGQSEWLSTLNESVSEGNPDFSYRNLVRAHIPQVYLFFQLQHQTQ